MAVAAVEAEDLTRVFRKSDVYGRTSRFDESPGLMLQNLYYKLHGQVRRIERRAVDGVTFSVPAGAFIGLLASAGIGLIAASMIWLMNAWHGTEPVHWLVALLVPLVSGAYFPPAILPGWLQVISAWLPQTYALDAIRRSVLGAAGSGVGRDLLLLTVFAVALLALGGAFFRLSLQVGRRCATLS